MSMLSERKVKVLGKWDDCLSCYCPAQCYREIVVTTAEGKQENYTLYLRWRHDDPWQGHILRNNEYSKNLFLTEAGKHKAFFFKDEELEQAKKKLVSLAKAMLSKGEPTF